VTHEGIVEVVKRMHAAEGRDWVVLREAWGIDAFAWALDPLPRPYVFERAAYEVKASRGDLLADLRKGPRKHALALDFSHTFQFIMPRDVFSPADKLPPGSGVLLIEPDGSITREREPQFRMPVRELSDGELATLLRYTRHETVRDTEARITGGESWVRRRRRQVVDGAAAA
jgi:hypothetical protein